MSGEIAVISPGSDSAKSEFIVSDMVGTDVELLASVMRFRRRVWPRISRHLCAT